MLWTRHGCNKMSTWIWHDYTVFNNSSNVCERVWMSSFRICEKKKYTYNWGVHHWPVYVVWIWTDTPSQWLKMSRDTEEETDREDIVVNSWLLFTCSQCDRPGAAAAQLQDQSAALWSLKARYFFFSISHKSKHKLPNKVICSGAVQNLQCLVIRFADCLKNMFPKQVLCCNKVGQKENSKK